MPDEFEQSNVGRPVTCPTCGNPQPHAYFCETCCANESLEQLFARMERKDREYFAGRRKPLLFRLEMFCGRLGLRILAWRLGDYVIRARPTAVEAHFEEGFWRR